MAYSNIKLAIAHDSLPILKKALNAHAGSFDREMKRLITQVTKRTTNLELLDEYLEMKDLIQYMTWHPSKNKFAELYPEAVESIVSPTIRTTLSVDADSVKFADDFDFENYELVARAYLIVSREQLAVKNEVKSLAKRGNGGAPNVFVVGQRVTNKIIDEELFRSWSASKEGKNFGTFRTDNAKIRAALTPEQLEHAMTSTTYFTQSSSQRAATDSLTDLFNKSDLNEILRNVQYEK